VGSEGSQSSCAYPGSELTGKDQRLSFQYLGDVEIEEVDVEDSLNDSSNNSNGIKETFSVVTIDPVENVKTTVGSQHKQVVAGDGLSFSSLGHHEKLWQNRASFQIDGESPENLSDGEGVVEHKS